MWRNNLYVAIVLDEQMLRPLEDNGAEEMLVAGHGTRQDNCAGPWWLPRASGGC